MPFQYEWNREHFKHFKKQKIFISVTILIFMAPSWEIWQPLIPDVLLFNIVVDDEKSRSVSPHIKSTFIHALQEGSLTTQIGMNQISCTIMSSVTVSSRRVVPEDSEFYIVTFISRFMEQKLVEIWSYWCLVCSTDHSDALEQNVNLRCHSKLTIQ